MIWGRSAGRMDLPISFAYQVELETNILATHFKIKQFSGVIDPYAEFKVREMERAKDIFYRLTSRMEEDLHSRLSLAVLGNSLDFFKDPEAVLCGIPDQVRDGIPFFMTTGINWSGACLKDRQRCCTSRTIAVRSILTSLSLNTSKQGRRRRSWWSRAVRP